MGEIDMRALFSISYGLYIISSKDDDIINGQTANAVTQVTADPPQIAVALNKTTLTHQCVKNSGFLDVSVLDQTAPLKIIGIFGFNSGRDFDKMSQCNFKLGINGCPVILDHTCAVLESKVIDSIDLRTHTVFICEVIASETLSKNPPMTYAYYHSDLKGKTPKNAPTYEIFSDEKEDTNSKEESKMKKYVCQICGWVYDPEEGDPDGGIEPGTAFEDIPDDWVCPVCGASKDQFEPQ